MNKSISKLPLDHSGKILTVRIKLVEPPGRTNTGLRLLTAQAERYNDANDKNDKYDKEKPT